MDDTQLGLVFEAPSTTERGAFDHDDGDPSCPCVICECEREDKAKAPPTPAERASIDERFEKFRAECPTIIDYVRNIALEAVRGGRKKIGIAQLWEVARWHLWSPTRDNGYKLNNDFRAPCARWLMSTEPELAGVFETRRRTSCDDE